MHGSHTAAGLARPGGSSSDSIVKEHHGRTTAISRYGTSSTGAFTDEFVPAGSGGLDVPSGVLFGSDGNFYVASRDTNEVLRYGSASQAVVTVSLSTPSAVPITVDYSTADGTATAGSDYTAVSGTITFAPGVTTRTILVPTLDDATEESAETFVVNLVNPSGGATIGDAQGVVTINDDDAVPTIDSLSDSPDPVKQGQTLTLTATVTGTPDSVSFYRDSNGNGTLDVGSDELLGTDSNGGDGWSVSVGIPGNFPTGTYTYFAQGTYNGANLTNVATTTGDVIKKKGGKPNLLAEAVGDGRNVTLLTQADAQAFAEYALQLWTDATGIAPTTVLHVTVADLDGNLLGVTNGNTITLDADAAGIGWFIDATPGDNVEFDLADPDALTHYDLLTAAAHELGHALGYEHSDDGDDVMAETLAIVTRRLPAGGHDESGVRRFGAAVPLRDTRCRHRRSC